MGTTRTRTTSARTTEKTASDFKSKSDYFRYLMEDRPKGLAMDIKDVQAKTGANYAFVYGVAKRAGLAEKRAGRRRPQGAKFVGFLRWMDPKITDARAAEVVVAYYAGEPFPTPKPTRAKKPKPAPVVVTPEPTPAEG